MSFLDKDVVIKKEKMFVEIHFHLLILEEKSSLAFVRWNGYWKKSE